jgi:MFS family permease
MAIYVLGAPLGGVLGYLAGGWLNERFGWQIMFVMLGLPGLLLAPLTWFTVREPRCTKLTSKTISLGPPKVPPHAPAQQNLKEVCVTLWANTTIRYLLLSVSVNVFFFSGISQWQPAFFIRSYGLTSGELGTWLAMISGFGSIVGTYLGGALASGYAANNERLQLKAMGVACGTLGVLSIFIYLSPNRYFAFGVTGVVAVLGSVSTGPLFATIQTLVLERQRATAIALIYLCANLIGMGLGPLAVGALSDALRPWADEESLRYALLVLCPGYLLGGWLQWMGSRTVIRDLSKMQVEETVPQ